MIRSREEFTKWVTLETILEIDDDSPIWIPETLHEKPVRHEWFVFLPSRIKHGCLTAYWKWCGEYLGGKVSCFYSGDDLEIWGFVEYDDITLWMLRWS